MILPPECLTLHRCIMDEKIGPWIEDEIDAELGALYAARERDDDVAALWLRMKLAALVWLRERRRRQLPSPDPPDAADDS